MLIDRQISTWQVLVLNVFWEDTQPGIKNLPSKSLISTRDGLIKPMK